MSANEDLVRIFTEMAVVLELTGANRFRVTAHQRVARILQDLTTDIAKLAQSEQELKAIEGIGAGSAKKILEFLRTGQVGEYEELLATIPRGLLQVLEVPGLGPKTVKMLWKEAGVTDLESLKKAIETQQLVELPRMGEKTIENLKESLAFAEKATQRMRLGAALPLAEAILMELEGGEGVERISYAGSLRRGCETIGDIDILAACSSPDDSATLMQHFRNLDIEGVPVEKVLAAGETKSSIRLESGVQVDLRIIPSDCWGSALMYFTGSKAHNVVMRERAVKQDLRLNEYGLFPHDGQAEPPQKRGIEPLAAATEEAIYAVLSLPFVPPELREDRGEFDLKKTPRLIEMEDIRAELHAHTIASDGRMTLHELAREAKRRGFHTVAVTDHSKSSIQANGLSPDRLLAHIDAVREANEKIKGIEILAGSEVDILADGRLDYDDDLLARLDIVVASPHTALKQSPEKATQRLLAAIRHPLVHIIGHPTGRVINKREGLSPDIEALAAAAAEHDTALEINANHLRLDLRDLHVRAVVAASGSGGKRGLISIDTDAHSPANFDELRYGILTARRGGLPPELCLNTWTKAKLHQWLKKKR